MAAARPACRPLYADPLSSFSGLAQSHTSLLERSPAPLQRLRSGPRGVGKTRTSTDAAASRGYAVRADTPS